MQTRRTTILSFDPATKAVGIEFGVEFALVHIDEPILDNEELVREVYDCKTIDDAFAERFLIAWPLVFVSQLFSSIFYSYVCVYLIM
jgi:hypothetical protein